MGRVSVLPSLNHAACTQADRCTCRALWSILGAVSHSERIHSVAFDGTSSTALLVDGSSGTLLAEPKMYNEAQAPDAAEAAVRMAPAGHTASSSTSTLAKLLAWQLSGQLQQARAAVALEFAAHTRWLPVPEGSQRHISHNSSFVHEDQLRSALLSTACCSPGAGGWPHAAAAAPGRLAGLAAARAQLLLRLGQCSQTRL